jgi:hypothetical protein
MTLTELLESVRRVEVRTNRLVNDTMVGAYLSHFKGRGMDFEELRHRITLTSEAEAQSVTSDAIVKKDFGCRPRSVKRLVLTARATGAILSLWLLCSCATKPHPPATGLPVEVGFNKDAGRGGHLVVMVRFDGKDLPFIVDTGSSSSCLDTSLESKLGEPVGTEIINQWGKHTRKMVYTMPKLYLGGVELKTGNRVLTSNLKQLPFVSDHPIMGMLGIDVLGNYCIQLDFGANKLRLF